MRVLSLPLGRFGNAIFRYLATTIFHIVYNATIIDPNTRVTDQALYITDKVFVEWMNAHLHGTAPVLDINGTYTFFGFFQHDKIYLKYKSQILAYIHTHPDDILMTDGVTEERPDFKYPVESYHSCVLLTHPTGIKQTYDVVVHLRLEHFIEIGLVIHPLCLRELLHSIGVSSYCLVVNSPTSELELRYIEYLHKHSTVHIESNDVLTDYHIMKNAKTLICSASTLSWAAAFFSNTVSTVYMPNYANVGIHQTCRTPIDNTILYEYRSCSESELRAFLTNGF